MRVYVTTADHSDTVRGCVRQHPHAWSLWAYREWGDSMGSACVWFSMSLSVSDDL